MKKIIKTFVSIFVLAVMIISSSVATATADEKLKDYDALFHVCNEFCDKKNYDWLYEHMIRVAYLMQHDFYSNFEHVAIDPESIIPCGAESEIRLNALLEMTILHEVKVVITEGAEIAPRQVMCCSLPNVRTSTMDTHEFVWETGTCLFVRRVTLSTCVTCGSRHHLSEVRLPGCGRRHQ